VWSGINKLFSRIASVWQEPNWEQVFVENHIEGGKPHTDMALLEEIQYHETGHAVTGISLGAKGKLLVLSVLYFDDSRGSVLWEEPPEFDTLDRQRQMAAMAYLVAGEEAEKIRYGIGHVSGGFGHDASSSSDDELKSDKENVEALAHRYIARWHELTEGDSAIETKIENVIGTARSLAKNTLLENWESVEDIVLRTKADPVQAGSTVRKIIDWNRCLSNISAPEESELSRS